MTDMIARIRDLAAAGLGVDDILVAIKLPKTNTARANIRAIAFGPREVVAGTQTVRVK